MKHPTKGLRGLSAAAMIHMAAAPKPMGHGTNAFPLFTVPREQCMPGLHPAGCQEPQQLLADLRSSPGFTACTSAGNERVMA